MHVPASERDDPEPRDDAEPLALSDWDWERFCVDSRLRVILLVKEAALPPGTIPSLDLARERLE